MRAGWVYKKLGDCCTIDYGTRVVQKKDGGTIYPVYGGGGETFRMDKYNREDCLIVARFAMSPKCVRFVQGKFFLNDSGLSVKVGGCLEQNFLNHQILFLNDAIYHLGKGAAQKNLDVNRFKKIIISIPPIPQQRLIVSELDKINSLIALKREQLKKYDELAQSLFYEMFGDPVENEKGWEVKKLGEVCIGKLKYGSGASAVEFDGRVRYVRITDIKEDGTLNNDAKSPSLIEDDYFLQEGDILFARSGATVGKTYIHQSSSISCLYAGYLIKAVPDQDVVLPLYLYNYTKSNFYRAWIDNNARAVAQPNINAKQYSDLLVPLPPLPLQRLFAHRIEQIEEQKKQITASLAKLETLLASRMQYWFE